MARKKSTPASPPAAAEVARYHVITELEQLKSIANPLRQRILREFAEQPRTTKQVALRLDESPTKLYHHVDALVENGLLTLVREVPKRGTTEKYYRAIARQFRVGGSALGDESPESERAEALLGLLDATREGITAALNAETELETSPEAGALALAVGGLSGDSAKDRRAIGQAITEALNDHLGGRRSKSERRYRFAFFLFPDDSDP